ncbi:MAG: ABC transporter permease [Haloarcula sp.]
MNLDIEVAAREDTPAWLVYGTPVFTVVAALAVSATALVAQNVSPLAAYEVMFVETLTTQLGLEQTLIKAVPLILTGLAVYFPLKAGLWNIGAEGQLYLGAIVGTWIGLNVGTPLFVRIPLMLLGAALAGAVWAGIPAWLRAKWDINEIITTLLLTFVAIELANYMVRGPMQGGQGNFPQSELLPTAGSLPNLLGTRVHAGIVVAVLMVIVTYVIINMSRFGFEITLTGENHEAAEQAGMNTFKVYVLALVVGGLFAALAGVGEIAGVQGRLKSSFSPGYGFTAIPIALLGRNGAFRVLLASLFFALLFVGGSAVKVNYAVSASLVEVIQALIILFLITAEFFKSYTVDVGIESPRTGGTAGSQVGGDA